MSDWLADYLAAHGFVAGAGSVATDAIFDAKGDLAVGTGADTADNLPVGSNDQVLVADSGQTLGVKWAAVPGTSAFVPVGTIDAKGDLLVGSANDAVDNLGVGSNGQVLTADSAQTLGVKWSTPSASGSVATDAIFDAKGDLAVGTGADTAAKLAVGSNGQILTADSTQTTGTKWASAGSSGIPTDGWIDDTAETWTFASATTFTVPTDLTAKYSKGTRLKLTQSATVKYFVVVASSFASSTTTVTITGGSDYTFANSAVSANYHSYEANPQGFPGWFNWTPTITGFSGSPSILFARFTLDGKLCCISFSLTGTSNATTFTFTLPVSGIGYNIANSADFLSPCFVQNAGTSQEGRVDNFPTQSTARVLATMAGGSFTNSGTKAAVGVVGYEI